MAEEEKAGGGEPESEGGKVGENGAASVEHVNGSLEAAGLPVIGAKAGAAAGAVVTGIKSPGAPVNGVGSPGKAAIKEVDSKEQNGIKKPKEGEDAEADQDDQGSEGSTFCFLWSQHFVWHTIITDTTAHRWVLKGEGMRTRARVHRTGIFI